MVGRQCLLVAVAAVEMRGPSAGVTRDQSCMSTRVGEQSCVMMFQEGQEDGLFTCVHVRACVRGCAHSCRNV